MSACVTTRMRGWVRSSHEGTWPFVTRTIERTQGAYFSIDRSEYFNSSLSRYRFRPLVSSRKAGDGEEDGEDDGGEGAETLSPAVPFQEDDRFLSTVSLLEASDEAGRGAAGGESDDGDDPVVGDSTTPGDGPADGGAPPGAPEVLLGMTSGGRRPSSRRKCIISRNQTGSLPFTHVYTTSMGGGQSRCVKAWPARLSEDATHPCRRNAVSVRTRERISTPARIKLRHRSVAERTLGTSPTNTTSSGFEAKGRRGRGVEG